MGLGREPRAYCMLAKLPQPCLKPCFLVLLLTAMTTKDAVGRKKGKKGRRDPVCCHRHLGLLHTAWQIP